MAFAVDELLPDGHPAARLLVGDALEDGEGERLGVEDKVAGLARLAQDEAVGLYLLDVPVLGVVLVLMELHHVTVLEVELVDGGAVQGEYTSPVDDGDSWRAPYASRRGCGVKGLGSHICGVLV